MPKLYGQDADEHTESKGWKEYKFTEKGWEGPEMPPPFGTHPHDEYTESKGWKDYKRPPKPPGGGKPPPTPSDRMREVRCLKCGTLNRVPPYQIQEVPRCKECGRRLPEPITTQTIRFVYANPLLWSALGASLIIAAIVSLDRYSPNQGLIWNVVNGKTAGIPTHYFVAAGALLFFLGLASAAKK